MHIEKIICECINKNIIDEAAVASSSILTFLYVKYVTIAHIFTLQKNLQLFDVNADEVRL